ncbi:hypothetical protein [Spirilliplanes yamanashiensis]|uniref:Uncharacterized protein n=1 Tax=Spirilliplanes yamanashiensis TaxID=42233 RepID=A0A8J3YCG5_9ACTN|nr:hypothetical protein [Spirilliplanes yamanashiensis]MDP9816673.1 hypothetical protein [Spirilliplanes yamanashiensis]GIJ06196.1 hypothetical protein Sya03_55480 [Spirilliplanes yamanashiensis]
MPARRRPARLYVGADRTAVVVTPRPPKLRTGRAVRRRHGAFVEVVPVPPGGPSLRGIAVPLVTFVGALNLLLVNLGLAWYLPAAVSVVVLVVVAQALHRANSPGTFAAPADGHLLSHPADRETMTRCVAVAHRIRRTWPALRHMIDPAVADQQLARALADLAAVLSRREEIRRLRDELAAVRADGLGADSSAVRALREQRAEVDALWRDADAEVEQHADRLHATALAGERLIREQQVAAAARGAERAVARLAPGRAAAADGAAEQLAGRTEAVIAAYRDLADRYPV